MKASVAQIRAVHSTLCPKQLGEILSEQYDLPKELICSYFLRGTNDIYKVQTSEKTYFLRIHRANTRSYESIAKEADLLKLWKQSGIEIAQPISNRNGDSVWQVEAPEGVRNAILFEEAKGNPDPTPQPELLEETGRTLAKIHKSGLRFPLVEGFPHYDTEYCIKESLKTLSDFLQFRSDIKEFGIFYQNLALNLNRALAECDLKDFAWGPVHGDFISCNLMLGLDGRVTVFDFDRIGYGWHVFEIASYLGHLCVHRNISDYKPLYQQISYFFLKGYESTQTISEEEKSLIPVFYLMRRLWMRAVCCRQYVDWSNQFLTLSNWKHDIHKGRRWASEVCEIKL